MKTSDIKINPLLHPGYEVPEDIVPSPSPASGEALRAAFEAGYWAYCGPTNEREMDRALADLAASWSKYSDKIFTAPSPSAHGAEVVAWRYLSLRDGRWCYCDSKPPSDYNAEPLYVTPSQPGIELREALQEAIDVFAGMADDEIEVELLPRLRAALTKATEGAVTQPAAHQQTPGDAA